MSYGITATSDNGYILLSSDYYCYNLLTSLTNNGVFSNTAQGTWNQYQVYYPSNNPPLIFIQLDIGDTASVWGMTQSGNYWLFNVSGSMRTTTSKVKPFGKIITSSSSGYGIEIKDSANQVNFASYANPLWITDYKDFDPTSLTSPNYDQLTGSLAYSNTNPIFLCNLIYAAYNPITSSRTNIGWKRTGTSTYTSYAIYTGVTSATARYQAMIVADLVL
jgi:hypothetical protein